MKTFTFKSEIGLGAFIKRGEDHFEIFKKR